ncbi:uncharacterized protein LOC116219857 isoform X2 [Clupea harengus]|uniref:Uncharacterized protein LOC116219857 isoform X2 n=1 Tax=Clupea harengus TaxID=7950 RepID=A0A6P8EU25_CLUHA|nr:uncharacterized protein LOC116219857 isoform X2 [Clupea harengus]
MHAPPPKHAPPPPPSPRPQSLTQGQAESADQTQPHEELYEYIEPQGENPALSPEHHHSKTGLIIQNCMEELKQEPPEKCLYIEEPLYIDPDELNLPVRKLKPFRPPPPSSASIRHAASERSHTEHYKRGDPGDSHADTSQKSGLRPQLSLPSHLPMASRGPQRTVSSSKNDLDMLMEWWGTTKCWENLYESDINHQVQEQNQQTLVSVAQRVRLALQLFECLHFHRGQLFNSHITQLHGLADQLDQTSKKAKVAGITGGSMAAAAGIVLAPVTLGLSLAATAIGVGFAVGGAKGGSAAMTDKLYSSQERKKVEEILQEHKAQMKDVEGCLQFINMGIERLCKFEPLTLQGADEEVVKMTRIAQILGRNSDLRPAALSSDALDGFTAGMDIYFEKQPKRKRA